MAQCRSRGKIQKLGNNFVKVHRGINKKATRFVVKKIYTDPRGQRLVIVHSKQLSRSIYCNFFFPGPPALLSIYKQ